MNLRIVATYILISCFSFAVFGKEASDEKYKPTIQPYLKVQFWNVYSEEEGN